MNTLDKVLFAALQQQQQQQLWREPLMRDGPQGVYQIIEGKKYLCFMSNDYLGLAHHPLLINALQKAATQYGVGSGASHVVNGHTVLHHELEQALAKLTHRPAALLFSTGFMANLAVISALCQRRDVVIHDRLNHASLLDGTKLSGAKLVRYRHLDIQDCEYKLQACSAARRKLIVTDGVFSMDGDIAPLPELSRLASAHDAWLMVDDAHGFGVLGAQGGGTLEHYDVSIEQVPVVVGTLSKAFACFGAFVAGSETLIETCRQFARPYIYTTAMPPALAGAALQAIAISQRPEEAWRRAHLQDLIGQFRAGAEKRGLTVLPSNTPIQPICLGSNATTLAMGEKLKAQGILVSTIRPPTVPYGQARLRISLSALHQKEHITQLLEALGAGFGK